MGTRAISPDHRPEHRAHNRGTGCPQIHRLTSIRETPSVTTLLFGWQIEHSFTENRALIPERRRVVHNPHHLSTTSVMLSTIRTGCVTVWHCTDTCAAKVIVNSEPDSFGPACQSLRRHPGHGNASPWPVPSLWSQASIIRCHEGTRSEANGHTIVVSSTPHMPDCHPCRCVVADGLSFRLTVHDRCLKFINELGELLSAPSRPGGTGRNSPIGELAVAVAVDLVLLGVGELQGGLRGIHAWAGAFDEPVAVADADDAGQGEVDTQVFALRPRHPQHSRGLQMGPEPGE